MKRRNINISFIGIAMMLLLICTPHTAQAHKWAVSTNALSWLSLGTINAEGGMSVSQHITLTAGVAVNPWTNTTSTTYIRLMNSQYGGYMGVKYWPWHIYSEWWIGVKAQYKNFEQSGILTSGLVKGNALGAGLSAGYSFMLTSHLNLDCGVGVWGGQMLDYEKYEEKNSKIKLVDSGARGFFFIDNIIVSLVYIF